MESRQMRQILSQVSAGELSVEDAMLEIKLEPFKELPHTNIDTHRGVRRGAAEVIYGAGKTKEQILEIVQAMQGEGQSLILITRMQTEAASYVGQFVDLTYDSLSGVGYTGTMPQPDGNGTILIATGGTSDIPVAKEAALTAQALGNDVSCLYDVGVAGIHRLFGHMQDIMQAQVIIAVAGMEGALASVIAGLAECPVIAVPTSVGYGASFGGVSALLSMLNSCAGGVSVVNIDNGFGAGYLANMINHLQRRKNR